MPLFCAVVDCFAGALLGGLAVKLYPRSPPSGDGGKSRKEASLRGLLPGKRGRLSADGCGGQPASRADTPGSSPRRQFTSRSVISSVQALEFMATGSSQAAPERPARRQSSIFATNEHQVIEEKLVIVMVGLPARGKSYISKALMRYLNFLGCSARLFNAGNARREGGKAGMSADFFDPTNKNARGIREQMAMRCLEELLDFLREAGPVCAVGILDATNTTVERRTKVRERCAKEHGLGVMFLESLCEDESVLEENYKLKMGNDDYKDMDIDLAYKDFKERVDKYELAYQPVQDVEDGAEIPYIKLIDAGKKLIKHKCQAQARKAIPGHVVSLLHSIHLGSRKIYLALVGESANDVRGVLGGDAPLTHTGKLRGVQLASFLNEREDADEDVPPTLVMCGTLQRHLHTARHMKLACLKDGVLKTRVILKLQRLSELCVGSMDGMTLEEVGESFPEEVESMNVDKLLYRFPGEGGESYQDLIIRLHDQILRLEQLETSAMVLCDAGVMRVFLAYFRGTPVEDLPDIEVPPGVVQFQRTHSGFQEAHLDLPPPPAYTSPKAPVEPSEVGPAGAGL